MPDEMAKVRVTRTIVVTPNQTSTVLYEARDEPYLAPHAHIEQIVAAKAGAPVALGEQAPTTRPLPANNQATEQQ